MILKMILKSFHFQCDFDFQITTSKMILILNHLYLGDLILILNHQHMMSLLISASEIYLIIKEVITVSVNINHAFKFTRQIYVTIQHAYNFIKIEFETIVFDFAIGHSE